MEVINFSQEKVSLSNYVREEGKKKGECKIKMEWQEVEEDLAAVFYEVMMETMF